MNTPTPNGVAPGEGRLRAEGFVLLAGSAIVIGAIIATRIVGDESAVRFWDNVHWTASYATATLLAGLGWRRGAGADRTARFWFTLALTSYTVGQILWDIQVFVGWNPFPGPSDAFFILLGPFFAVGYLSQLHKRMSTGGMWAAGLDTAVIAFGALSFTLALYLPLTEPETAFSTAVMAAYPVLLLSAFGAGVGVLTGLRLKPSAANLLSLSTTFINGMLWMTWNYLTLREQLGDGILVNYAFSINAILTGIGARFWSGTPSKSETWERFCLTFQRVLPLVLVLVGSLSLAFGRLLTPEARTAADVGVVMIVMLAIIRQSMLLHERDRLLAAERTLHESEVRYRIVADNTYDWEYWLSPEGRFLYVSPSCRRVSGYLASDFEANAALLDELVHPEDRQAYRSKRASAQGSQTAWNQSFRIIRKDGQERWVEQACQSVFDSTGAFLGTRGSIRDVTERKHAERSLEYSRAQLQSFVENTPAAVAMLDLDLRYIAVSRRWLQDYSLGDRDLTGLHHYDVFPEIRSIPDWLEIHRRCLAGAIERRDEDRLARPDGTEDWLRWEVRPWRDETGRIGGIIMYTEVINERIHAEQALRDSENRERELNERFALAVESAGIGVFDLDIVNDVLTWDEQMCRLYGVQSERWTGAYADWRGFVHPEDLPRAESEVKRAINGVKPFDTEFRVIWPNGEVRFIRAFARVVHGAGGSAIRMTGVNFDITANKQAEEEQDRLRAQLIQSQKMEAVGQLAGGVAHDFNNLLHVISGYTDLALADIDDPHPARKSLSEVVKAAERASVLVSQLLAFSRRQIMQPEDLDLNEVISQLLTMLGRIIGENIQVQFVPAGGLGAVRADRGMMEQILMNLCVNARDAMGAEGTLGIETANVLFDDEFCVVNPWATPGNWVQMMVSDTGCGMDDETLAHIFEPFFTTKDKAKGTGLGLATVYGIMQQHGGMIRVYSELGKGTAFKLYLPVVERAAKQTTAREVLRPMGGTETILLAEDDERVRSLVTITLEQAGYTVLAARDGAEAVRLFKEHANAVDLLLMDVVMPNMGGREAYDQIQLLKPDIRVLFSSGYSESSIHTNFILKEGTRLIQKPYNSRDLLRQLREIIDGTDGKSG